ncbi:hypothetical protein [Nesterenkonia pannonica]|uniref:hypothetical protein n=1 Tax=Nesterenkonia pannonica TaxID=1548602 RepID=UPI0021647AEE|nr:hypothetical protein [Nesterenkonia pannonica]
MIPEEGAVEQEHRRSSNAGEKPRDPLSSETGLTGYESEPIDPVISEPEVDTSLIPLVKPSADVPAEDEGFVSSLTGSIASSWRSAAEEATLEWEEYDAEAAARALEEAETQQQTRHSYSNEFSSPTLRSPRPDPRRPRRGPRSRHR